MNLTGLHILLTYQCNFECDHCFVWGSPWQNGTLTLAQIQDILQQASEADTIDWIYFEGGEPFLYYPILVRGVEIAAHQGFRVGLVTNSYWATSVEDAHLWLKPFQGKVEDLSVSGDLYHWDEKISQQVENAQTAAHQLSIPIGIISVAQPQDTEAAMVKGQLPVGETGVMYRGRAVDKLTAKVTLRPWTEFTACPHEDLRDPGRVHLDPLGHVHICQGITMGNIFNKSLSKLCAAYDPASHPITGPLVDGGPVELVRRYNLPHKDRYADACHLCYQARTKLRSHFPRTLAPDQVYGEF